MRNFMGLPRLNCGDGDATVLAPSYRYATVDIRVLPMLTVLGCAVVAALPEGEGATAAGIVTAPAGTVVTPPG